MSESAEKRPVGLEAVNARIDAITATAARLNPRNLTQLTEPPPKPYRELSVKASCDRTLFERHAWPMISANAIGDPTVQGEPIGYSYTVGGGERKLSVFWPAEAA